MNCSADGAAAVLRHVSHRVGQKLLGTCSSKPEPGPCRSTDAKRQRIAVEVSRFVLQCPAFSAGIRSSGPCPVDSVAAIEPALPKRGGRSPRPDRPTGNHRPPSSASPSGPEGLPRSPPPTGAEAPAADRTRPSPMARDDGVVSPNPPRRIQPDIAAPAVLTDVGQRPGASRVSRKCDPDASTQASHGTSVRTAGNEMHLAQ